MEAEFDVLLIHPETCRERRHFGLVPGTRTGAFSETSGISRFPRLFPPWKFSGTGTGIGASTGTSTSTSASSSTGTGTGTGINDRLSREDNLSRNSSSGVASRPRGCR